MIMEKHDVNIYIGNQIEVERISQEISQTNFAKELGMSRSSLCNVEKGVQTLPIYKLYTVASLLGKPIEFFLPNVDTDKEVEKLQSKIDIPIYLLKKLSKLNHRALEEMIRFYDRWELKG